MKKHLLIALGATVLATTTSCKQEFGVELTQGALDTKATVTACVTSATTHKKLAGVVISQVAAMADTVSTDTMGFAKMTLTAGDHEIILNATGYASRFHLISVTPLNGESTTPIFGESHHDVEMFPLSAKLTGYVVLQNALDNTTSGGYAKEATVSIYKINGQKIPYPIVVKTNAEGFFSMVAPAGTTGGLGLMITYTAADGTSYYTELSVEKGLFGGETKMLSTTKLYPVQAATYPADIIAKPKVNTDALRITFPVAIDTEKVKDGTVIVTGAVRVEVAYADNNRTIILTPAADKNETDPAIIAAGKKWSVGVHNFQVSIKSVQGGWLQAQNGFFEIK